jgi:hypothetical protein
MDIGGVTDELYGMPPSEFTVARDARAATARLGGDSRLAADIKRLKKPTASAWLVNQLARQRRRQVDELLELGAALRDAHERLAGDDLRLLSQQRHQAVEALGREAHQLATDARQTISQTAEREMEETLEAALADPSAAEAVRSGCLTAALSYSGLGDTGAMTAVPTRPRPSGGTRLRAPVNDEESSEAEQRRPEREEALRDALEAADVARRRALEAADRVARAERRVARHNNRIRKLAEQLEQAHAEEREAASEQLEAARARHAADRAKRNADDRVLKTRAVLDRLRR